MKIHGLGVVVRELSQISDLFELGNEQGDEPQFQSQSENLRVGRVIQKLKEKAFRFRKIKKALPLFLNRLARLPDKTGPQRQPPLIRFIQGFEDQQRTEPFPLENKIPFDGLKFRRDLLRRRLLRPRINEFHGLPVKLFASVADPVQMAVEISHEFLRPCIVGTVREAQALGNLWLEREQQSIFPPASGQEVELVSHLEKETLGLMELVQAEMGKNGKAL